ncbi:hypothetical protein ACG95P_20195 [Acinetobacter guillouiae]|uniref:hypothetical protein n=1 Tax=Acinetobacter guillouiae TaxID=106649 RepID=UPI003AF8137F
MKKILILGLLVGLSGCKESSTGLDKSVLNTAYKKCSVYLGDLVKSPSSLKISSATPKISFPQDNVIYKYFNESLIDKNTGKISQSNIDEKTRFRKISIDLDYEAQNSYGASLRDSFSCSYVYKLKGDEESPDEIFLTNWETEDEITNIFIPLDVGSESSFRMNDKIVKPISEISSHFTDRDKLLFKNIEFFYQDSKATAN